MSDSITIQLNGQRVAAEAGEMLIAVADRAGVSIPRFCYHPKLSVAANCRMCLVEVVGAKAPAPACATPVTEGMKVRTQSKLARGAQRATMEFLLINHPLDCPICDQGGECELQDLSLEYGEDVSRYAEARRVVPDPDLGALVSTDMTRCIHCTRCVRFTEEIAGVQELGAFGRGEFMKIGTYIQKALDSELSGCVIDLCPVGALNAKPSRMRARSWDMVAHAGLGEHDGAGSHLSRHTLRGQQIRSVPREQESINEAWLSDRDRFSYQAASHPRRLTEPHERCGDKWFPISWDEALQRLAIWLNRPGPKSGLIHPSATLEECFRFAQLLRARGGRTVEHRLRANDFRFGEQYPLTPHLGCAIEQIAEHDLIVLVGSFLRHDQPIINHRLRMAALAGTEVWVINPCTFDWNFPLHEESILSPRMWSAALADPGILPDLHARLCEAKQPLLWLGPMALNHPDAGLLYASARDLCRRTDATLGVLPEGANAAGAWLAGCVSHRSAGGHATAGVDLDSAMQTPQQLWMLYGLDPQSDVDDPARFMQVLESAHRVVGIQSFLPEEPTPCHLILPIATVGEREGHLINLEGCWQTMTAATSPPGETRQGVALLEDIARAAGAVLDYRRDQLMVHLRTLMEEGRHEAEEPPLADLNDSRLDASGLMRVGAPSLYQQDAVVRRAHALQQTALATELVLRLHPDALRAHNIPREAEQVRINQGEAKITLPIVLDSSMSADCVYLATGDERLACLGSAFGRVGLSNV